MTTNLYDQRLTTNEKNQLLTRSHLAFQLVLSGNPSKPPPPSPRKSRIPKEIGIPQPVIMQNRLRMRPPQPSPALSKFWHHEVSVLSHKPTAEPSTAYDLSIKSIISRGRCGGGGKTTGRKSMGNATFSRTPRNGLCVAHLGTIYPRSGLRTTAENKPKPKR